MPAVSTISIPLTPPQAVPATAGTLYTPAPGPASGMVVLAHGAASGPDSDVLVAVADALAAAGTAVLSFAFPYRHLGRRAPDPARRLLAAWRDAVRVAAELAPGPLVLGGRSMGGRMASLLVAEGAVCDGLVLLAYPLHGRDRTVHWPSVRVPVLFVCGDRDRLCDLERLEDERRRLAAPSELAVVRGADHSFAVRARDGRARAEVLDEIAGAVARWVAARSASSSAA